MRTLKRRGAATRNSSKQQDRVYRHDSGDQQNDDDREDVIAFSVQEFCRLFSISPSTTYVLIRNRVIRVKHFGRKVLLNGDDCRRWYDALPSTAPNKHLPSMALRGKREAASAASAE